MLSKISLLTFLTALLKVSSLLSHPQQDLCYCYPTEFHTYKAFEKVYVDAKSILCMPDGIYYKPPRGSLEKVSKLFQDYQGKYILRIYSQCAHCGKVYRGTKPPEGWSCLENNS